MSDRQHAPGLPRGIQAALATGVLVLASPILAAAAVAIRLGSPGPVLFRQQRVGRHGRTFELFKFRTMRVDNTGMQVTARDDDRITPVGRWLRRTKLDELPELWNVVRGEMSLVGPRPEVPRYVDLEDPLWSEVLEATPGLTDPIAITLRDEESVMAQVRDERESFYLRTLQKYKLLGSVEYLRKRTWRSDVEILARTMVAIVLPHSAPPPGIDEITRTVERHRNGHGG